MEETEDIFEAPAFDGESPKSIVVEFDTAVFDGSTLLFETAAGLLKEAGVELTQALEARWLLNRAAQTGLSALLQSEKGSPSGGAQMAQTLIETFTAAVSKRAPGAVTPAFKAFLKTLTAKGVHAAIVSRCDPDALRTAFDGFEDGVLSVLQDDSAAYGNLKRDGWARACRKCSLRAPLAVALTGSGYGVRGALQAGMSAVAIPNARCAWQDFGGADREISAFDDSAARDVLSVLHIV